MAEDGRIPWLRYAWAATLGILLLGMTYVLFDPDLGTPVPLFQEITCRGRLDVPAANGAGQARLTVPETAVKTNATLDGALRPAYFQLYKREPGEEWTLYFSVEAPTGEHFFYVAPTTEQTEVYVVAKDLEGRGCKGTSPVVTARSSSAASVQP